MEEGDEEELRRIRGEWSGVCSRPLPYIQVVQESFYREKQNLIWDNRMIDNRLAVAQQLSEISRIMEMVAEDLYDISGGTPQFTEDLKKALRKKHILLKQVWVMDKVEGEGVRFFLICGREDSGQCISMWETAQILSEDVVDVHDARETGSRCIVNGEYHTIHFVEDVNYQMMYGVLVLQRKKKRFPETICMCRQEDGGRFVMCLSDGMGSGMEACRESGVCGRTPEQFLDSGFSQETAAKMVNSALVLKRQDGMFSTVDICAVDLYTGICSFLKAGASSTFIKRDHWVEAITSKVLRQGLYSRLILIRLPENFIMEIILL